MIYIKDTKGPIARLVEYEWRQFDSVACPEAHCGGNDPHGDEVWRKGWDCEYSDIEKDLCHKADKCLNLVGWFGFPTNKLDLLDKTSDINWLHLLPPQDEEVLISLPGGKPI